MAIMSKGDTGNLRCSDSDLQLFPHITPTQLSEPPDQLFYNCFHIKQLEELIKAKLILCIVGRMGKMSSPDLRT